MPLYFHITPKPCRKQEIIDYAEKAMPGSRHAAHAAADGVLLIRAAIRALLRHRRATPFFMTMLRSPRPILPFFRHSAISASLTYYHFHIAMVIYTYIIIFTPPYLFDICYDIC
jgi:hypothetical protein